MSYKTVQLSKNLRRNVLRGHPWVYKESLKTKLVNSRCELVKVIDIKGIFLAWAMGDPHSVLALRIISLSPECPVEQFYKNLFSQALKLRDSHLLSSSNSYRLFNGEGDRLPGLVCDVYNDVAVVQFDGQGPYEFWDQDLVSQWIVENTSCKSVIDKSRIHKGYKLISGSPMNEECVEIIENNIKFLVNIPQGQKTGFFLDQRENREYVRQISSGLSVVNLFSYTGGFSVYAGKGGAKSVVSVDLSPGAIDLAKKNWELNDLSADLHTGVCADVFEYIHQKKDRCDMVIVDPPSMAHSEGQKERAIEKYIETFALAAKMLHSGGHLVLSSCSSHVSFNDFFEIINLSLSKARKTGQIVRISGQGGDHPFVHICHELRYLKFVHIRLN